MGTLRRSCLRAGLVLAFSLAMVLLLTVTAAAHEHREVGDYEMTVGFLNEPAILEEPNGLSLRVAHGHGDAGEPVEGLADILQAEVTFGEQSMPLELRPAFGDPGAYQADFIPTAAGAYTFHITGSIEGMDIDETFTSSPDTFSEVESRASMSFPNNVASVGDVAADASDASDTADSAQLLAIIAIIVGGLGLIAGLVAILLNRRTAPAVESPGTTHEATV